MTLKQSLSIAVRDYSDEDWARFGQTEWNQAEAFLVASRLCPRCACDGETVKLGRYHAPTAETYGGRYCPTCEDFTVCGPQDSGFERAPCYGGTESLIGIVSDADPGL